MPLNHTPKKSAIANFIKFCLNKKKINMSKLGWMKHKPESGLLGEISITSDMQMTPPLWQKMKKS